MHKATSEKTQSRGLTLIETLVAISILTISIVAPMSLTVQSLSAAYYARDQITAFYLAQEAIESVRAARDSNILRIAFAEPDPACTPTTIMCGIYLNQDFYIDTRNNNMTLCDAQAGCPLLQTDGNLYAYGGGDPAWTDTQYRRTIRATYIPPGETEIQIEVTVRWRSGRNQEQVFTLTSMMYRWVDDSIAG